VKKLIILGQRLLVAEYKDVNSWYSSTEVEAPIINFLQHSSENRIYF